MYDDDEVDNVLSFPGQRYRQLTYYPLYDRPKKKAEWLRIRRLGRLWARFKDDDRTPPYDVFAYWAWSNELNRVKKRPAFADRVFEYKYAKEHADMPF